MDIRQALQAAMDGETCTEQWLDHKIGELPKTDVVVQRGLLLRALTEIKRLELRMEQAARHAIRAYSELAPNLPDRGAAVLSEQNLAKTAARSAGEDS